MVLLQRRGLQEGKTNVRKKSHPIDTVVSMSKNKKNTDMSSLTKSIILSVISINVSESVHSSVTSSPWFARLPGLLPPLLPVWRSWNHLADPVEENSLTQSCSFIG